MTSEWNYKNQNSSYRGKFRGNFDEGKGNLVRVIRVNRVKMTEKRGEIQGKWDLIRVQRGVRVKNMSGSCLL